MLFSIGSLHIDARSHPIDNTCYFYTQRHLIHMNNEEMQDSDEHSIRKPTKNKLTYNAMQNSEIRCHELESAIRNLHTRVKGRITSQIQKFKIP